MCMGTHTLDRGITFQNGCFTKTLYEQGDVLEHGIHQTELLHYLRPFLSERVFEFYNDLNHDTELLIDMTNIMCRIELQDWNAWTLWSFDESYVLELILSNDPDDSECYWV